MGMLGQLGDMYKLQKEAKRIKKELTGIHVFAEVDSVKVTVNGEQTLVSIEILSDDILTNKKKLEKALLEATNRAVKKAQEIAAEKMKAIMGGFPGMGQ